MSKIQNLICDEKNNAQKSMDAAEEKFVGAIDQGISNIRFVVFSSKTQMPVAIHHTSTNNISVYDGWVEQDPGDILRGVKQTIDVTCKKLKVMNILPSAIAAIGVTNQRDTTLVWDKYTGAPLYNALVWMDMATTQSIVNRFMNKQIPKCDTQDEQRKHLQFKCGSMLNPYYSVFKLIWLIENIPQVSKAIEEERCMFGTMDTWLIWNLTGGINGGVHMTDVTNASRTMLMDINSLRWDKSLFIFFNIPKTLIFPEIRSCSEVYGLMTCGPLLNIPISGCIGDHQGALVGQLCLTAGSVKCTFGSSCFLMYNTGRKPVISSHGLLTTIAYKIGKHSDPIYALEGSVAMARNTTEWLKDNMWIMDVHKNVKGMANNGEDINKINLVPSLSELYSPYWKTEADGKITGLIMETSEAILMRETLEGICSQANVVMEFMQKDTGYPIMALNVDGNMSTCDTFLKILTNITCFAIVRPKMMDTTALGAAFAAGFAVGVWNMNSIETNNDTFIKASSEEDQKSKYVLLEKTIDQTKVLDKNDKENDNNDFAGS